MWSHAIHDTIIGWRKPISSVLSCEASAAFRHKLATPASPSGGGDKLETLGEKPVMGQKKARQPNGLPSRRALRQVGLERSVLPQPPQLSPGQLILAIPVRPRIVQCLGKRFVARDHVPLVVEELPERPLDRGPSRSGSGLAPERRVRCRTRPMRPNGASKRRTQLCMHPMRPNRGQQCLIGLRLRPMRPSGASKRRIQLRLRPMRPSGSPQRLKACGRPSDDSSLGAGRYDMVPRQRRNRGRGTKRSL